MTSTPKFAIRFLIVALMILILVVTPLALLLTWMPFHDVLDYERFGLCDGFNTAEACDEYVTQTVVFWRMYFPQTVQILFLPCMAAYLLIELTVWLIVNLKSKLAKH